VQHREHRGERYRLWVGGPVPQGAVAITVGSLIIVRDGYEYSEHLLRHELVHVRQWRRHGFLGFGVRYVAAYAKWRLCRKGHYGAYLRIPLEVEAEWSARRALMVRREMADTLDPVGR